VGGRRFGTYTLSFVWLVPGPRRERWELEKGVERGDREGRIRERQRRARRRTLSKARPPDYDTCRRMNVRSFSTSGGRGGDAGADQALPERAKVRHVLAGGIQSGLRASSMIVWRTVPLTPPSIAIRPATTGPKVCWGQKEMLKSLQA